MNITINMVFKDMDRRADRMVKVIEVGERTVTIENIVTGRQTHANKSGFNGRRFKPARLKREAVVSD